MPREVDLTVVKSGIQSRIHCLLRLIFIVEQSNNHHRFICSRHTVSPFSLFQSFQASALLLFNSGHKARLCGSTTGELFVARAKE